MPLSPHKEELHLAGCPPRSRAQSWGSAWGGPSSALPSRDGCRTGVTVTGKVNRGDRRRIGADREVPHLGLCPHLVPGGVLGIPWAEPSPNCTGWGRTSGLAGGGQPLL